MMRRRQRYEAPPQRPLAKGRHVVPGWSETSIPDNGRQRVPEARGEVFPWRAGEMVVGVQKRESKDGAKASRGPA
jgi:hypothetical protein